MSDDEMAARAGRIAREWGEGSKAAGDAMRAELAGAWDKGYAAHALGIANATSDPNPYREER